MLEGVLEKRRGWVGTCGEDSCPSLGGRINRQKIERMGGPLALDGRRLMGGLNNQPKVVGNGEGGVTEEMRPGRNVWGTLSHCLGHQMEMSDEKNREMGWALALDGRRLKILHTTTNQ